MHKKDPNYTLLYLQYCPPRPDYDAVALHILVEIIGMSTGVAACAVVKITTRTAMANTVQRCTVFNANSVQGQRSKQLGVTESQETGTLGRPRSRWVENINVGLQEVGWVAWTGSIWLRIGTGSGLL